MRRMLIVAAAGVYVFLVGCVMWRGKSEAPQAVDSANNTEAAAQSRAIANGVLPFRGVDLEILRVDMIDEYEHCIDEIADVGADTVQLVINVRQENKSSCRIYLDMRNTPTVEQLTKLIQHAKSRKLKVILMPIVLLDMPVDNDWRGVIQPTLWEDWFDSYRSMIIHFAEIAQNNGVDMLVVGSELVSSETKLDEWTKTIKQIRGTYKGLLTYSSNWDHYTSVPFWNQLDLIGMNSYWKLDNGKKTAATVDDMKQAWKEIQSDLIPFSQKKGKPVVLLEVGWCSMSNMAYEPWDYTTGDPTDVEVQRKLYQAFFESWYGNPHLGGFNVWEWQFNPGGAEDRSYSPKNKPAEKVLREWLAKSKWEVKP